MGGEDTEHYDVGGFHRVRLGEVLNSRYRVEKQLGRGHFSQVWACVDDHENRPVAVKVLKSVDKYKSVAQREISLLRSIAEKSERFVEKTANAGEGSNSLTKPLLPCVVRLLDHFEFSGPNGLHPCVVLGRCSFTLFELMKNHRRMQLPWSAVLVLARDVLRGLDLLHRGCGLLHADVKPENILFRIANREPDAGDRANKRRRVGFDMPVQDVAATAASGTAGGAAARRALAREVLDGAISSSSAQFCLCDLGNSCEIASPKQRTRGVQTCEYKPPECVLGVRYGEAADIWAAGCSVFEAAHGHRLFNPFHVGRLRRRHLRVGSDAALPEKIPPEEEHLSQIAELFGPIPEALMHGHRVADFLKKRDGQWSLRKMGIALNVQARYGILEKLQRRLLTGTDQAVNERQPTSSQLEQLARFLLQTLRLDPATRPSAEALLTDALLSSGLHPVRE